MNDMFSTENEGRLLCRFDSITLNYLQEGAKWARFLSIVGFILLLFVLCSGLMNLSAMAMLSLFLPPAFQSIGLMYSIFIFFMLLILAYAFPLYYLYQASNNMLLSIRVGSIQTLDSAFKYLKSHYRYIGIFTIVVLSFYVLIFVLIALFMVL